MADNNKKDVKVDPKEAAKKAKKEARKKAKKEAYDLIKQTIEGIKDPQVKEKAINALKVVRPSLYGIVRAGSATADFIAHVVEAGKPVSEVDIFNTFKMGRKECAGHIRKSLRKAEPKDRTWIAFNKDKGEYTVMGTGEKAPEGWTGYVPAEEEIDLK